MKKLIYSLSVLCVLLALATFTLLCCYLSAADGYNRLYRQRNELANRVDELERENQSLKLDNPRYRIDQTWAMMK